MSKERPQWILSAYGPGKDAPTQLFGGHPREQSFEELRVRHYELATQNNQQKAIQEAQTLVANAEQQVHTALNDIDGAIKYVIDGENEHPNRIDMCKAKGAPAPQSPNPSTNQQSAPAFSQLSSAAQTSSSKFGQPSSSSPPFGQPSATSTFGRPSAPAFGQSPAPVSAFGDPSTSTFGQPSTFGRPGALGRPTTSFGQPSSSLGQPSSSFGKPSLSAPAFGKPATPTSFDQRTSPFGDRTGINANPQQLINPSQPSNPFGQSSAPTHRNPFVKSSAPASAQPNPFGPPSAPASTLASSFGPPSVPSQPSVFGRSSAPSTASAFGQPQASKLPTGPGQLSTAPSNPFGQPSGPQTASTFGQPSRPGPSPFGQPPSKARTFYANRPVPAFGFDIASMKFPARPLTSSNSDTVQQPTAPIANGAAPKPASIKATSSVQVQKDMQGKVRTWNGKSVSYVDDEPCYKGIEGSWQRIWFPDGPPVFTKTADLPDEVYDEATKENYKHVKEYGAFKDGMMPDLPPRREWCTWDF